MANYTLLFQSNVLPTVGVLQKLLNRRGDNLKADAIFGPKTKHAVIEFQRHRGLNPDGIVGLRTWPSVSVEANLPIVDSVDVFDPLLVRDTDTPLVLVGANPLLIGGMSNGVEQAVTNILAAAPSNVFLLRFHGHGAPGLAGIADGQGNVPGDWYARSYIAEDTLNVTLPMLRRLRGIFGPYGSVEFMQCQTGAGPEGRRVLSRVAEALGVPATGAVYEQAGLGDGNLPFGYSGPTVTVVPGGGSLSDWANSLPDFPSVTVSF